MEQQSFLNDTRNHFALLAIIFMALFFTATNTFAEIENIDLKDKLIDRGMIQQAQLPPIPARKPQF